MLRALPVLLLLLAFSSPAHAFLGFGKDDAVDTPPDVQTEQARPLYERALKADAANQHGRALRLYKRVTKRYPASDFAPQAYYNTAVIHYDRRKWKKAFESFQSILARHPEFPRFNQLIEYQFNIALSLARGEGTRFLFVIPYRALNRSTEYFETIIRNAPYSPMAPLALMNVALIHQYKNQTAEAIDALDRLINLYPDTLLAEDAYLELAQTFATLVQGPQYDQGATREAISYFEDFLILFSESQDAAVAEQGLADMQDVFARSKLIIGQYYFKYRRWYEAASIFFNEAITTAPESPSAETARQYLDRIEQIRQQREQNAEAEPRDPQDRQREKSFIRRLLDKVIPG